MTQLDWLLPATRTGDHHTSIAAANKVGRITGPIALKVLHFVRERGIYGATDDEIKVAFPHSAESSYRKRRSELASEKYGCLIEDTGLTRLNREGNAEKVWRAK